MKLKSRDTELLAEAYELKLLREGVLSSGIKAILQPLFNKLFVKIKEKSPEAFAEIIKVKTPQELIDLINSHKSSSETVQQQSESIQDIIGKIKNASASLVDKLEANGTIGVVFAGLGAIMSLLEYSSSGSPNYGMMLAGLFMVAAKFAVDGGVAVYDKFAQNP